MVSITFAVGIWWAVSAFGVFSSEVVPSPSQVWHASVTMAREGVLWPDIYESARRALSGFGLGAALGIALGVLTARSKLANTLLDGTLQAIRPIPAIAIVPLAVLWFGIGEESKLFLVAFGVFFPVWITTHTGVATTRADYLRVAACMGLSRRQTMIDVVVPASLPMIVAGLRIGIATSFLLIVAAEMTGADVGLGFQLDQARLFSRADRMFVALIALGLLGAFADQLFHRATQPLVRWAKEQG